MMFVITTDILPIIASAIYVLTVMIVLGQMTMKMMIDSLAPLIFIGLAIMFNVGNIIILIADVIELIKGDR